MAGAFRLADVIWPSKDPKMGETPDALSRRFNCKKGSLLYDFKCKNRSQICVSLRFNCK
jgi:hypothetical protein